VAAFSQQLFSENSLATTMPLIYLVVFNEKIVFVSYFGGKVSTVTVQTFCGKISPGFAPVLAAVVWCALPSGAENHHNYSVQV